MSRKYANIPKETMGAGGVAAKLSLLDSQIATVVTVVRRLGFVLGKAHELCESDLIRNGFHETAEVLRDELKPLIDALVHFEVTPRGDVSRETRDTETEV